MRRILFVSCYFASDFHGMVWGPFIRMRLLVEAACRVAPRVDLLLFAAADKVSSVDTDRIAASIRQTWGVEVHVVLAERARRPPGAWPGLRRLIAGFRKVDDHPDYGRAAGLAQARAVTAAIHEDTDLVIAQKLEAALPVAMGVRHDVARIVDIDDVEHVSSRRRMRQLPWSFEKAHAFLWLPAIRRDELRTIAAFDAGLVCSAVDLAYLEGLADTHIEVVPNAIDFGQAGEPSGTQSQTIVFFANYAYRPNVDAAEELMHAIFPLVLAAMPNATLLIAGAFAEKLPAFGRVLHRTRITGFVDDVAEIYRQAALVCCPIRAGGGTRIKIIEASAWKIPTVATSLAAEGLDLRDGEDILLADDVAGLARRCIELLRDPSRGRDIGRSAYDRAKGAYDRAIGVERLMAVYRRTVAARAQARPSPRT